MDEDKQWVPRASFPPRLSYHMKDMEATAADPTRNPYLGWKLILAQGRGAWKVKLGRDHEYEEFLHTRSGESAYIHDCNRRAGPATAANRIARRMVLVLTQTKYGRGLLSRRKLQLIIVKNCSAPCI